MTNTKSKSLLKKMIIVIVLFSDPNAKRLSDGASVMQVAYSNEKILKILLDEE